MAQPLEGIRVIDLTTMISGPLATAILADQGAEVIKIERPDGGDHTRNVAGRRNGVSASFLHANRGKRSVALDLKRPAALEAVLRLAGTADVFVQNFRPGVAERIGLGEAAIRARRPDIVHASIAGFGFDGPFAGKPVYDPLIQALSGLASVQGAGGRPRLVRTILPDKATAMQAAQAISAALVGRARTGQGQTVTLSMLDTVVWFLFASDMSGLTFVGDEAAEPGEAQSYVELIYDTADGHIAVSALADRDWAGLARAVGRPDWLKDPRFATVELREVNKAARLELTQAMLLTATTAEWMARLEAEDVPCAPALTRAEMLAHPQVAANGAVAEGEHPEAGRVRYAPPPARFGGEALVPRPSRPLGADTADVLAGLGYGPAEIAAIAGRPEAAE